MSKLTLIEKQIKRINSRIVQQVKTYGLESPIVQDYVSDLYGQKFVKIVPRKIGKDSSGNSIFQDVPQIITSKKYGTNETRFIESFERKITPGQQVKNFRQELKKAKPKERYTRAEVEDLLNRYIRAKNNAESAINEFYQTFGLEITMQDEDISFFQARGTKSRLDFIYHYESIAAKNANPDAYLESIYKL